jgi:hypothetical protein
MSGVQSVIDRVDGKLGVRDSGKWSLEDVS